MGEDLTSEDFQYSLKSEWDSNRVVINGYQYLNIGRLITQIDRRIKLLADEREAAAVDGEYEIAAKRLVQITELELLNRALCNF